MGERKSLAELKQMAQDDPELQSENLSKERRQELINDLIEARAEKQTNARGSNRVASRDVQTTIDRVTGEVSLCTFDEATTRLSDEYSLTLFSSTRDSAYGC